MQHDDQTPKVPSDFDARAAQTRFTTDAQLLKRYDHWRGGLPAWSLAAPLLPPLGIALAVCGLFYSSILLVIGLLCIPAGVVLGVLAVVVGLYRSRYAMVLLGTFSLVEVLGTVCAVTSVWKPDIH